MYEVETAFANELADRAGEVVLKYFRKPLEILDKDDTSPVTVADRQCEEIMRSMISKRFPDHGIFGEEFGSENPDAEYVWVLDPIDGTKSFITGSPLFGTLIALLHHKKPVVGIISQPYIGECWVGVQGRQTTLNGRHISVRKGTKLSDAALYSTGGSLMFRDVNDRARFDALSARVKNRRYSADCYAYGLLSAGCIDLVCEAGMKLYDYAALVPVVEGAGGLITDWTGAPVGSHNDGRVLAAGDPDLLRQAVKVLSE